MNLITGTFIYNIDYFIPNFIAFAENCFHIENVIIAADDILEITYQLRKYKIEFLEHKTIRCIQISIYADDNDTQFLRKFPAEGILEIIQNHLIALYRLDYFECKMYEPDDFIKISQKIEDRTLHISMIKKYYRNQYDINQDMIDCEFVIDVKELKLLSKVEIMYNPYTIKIVEVDKNSILLAEFFIKLGCDLGWENSCFFDALFLPTEISEINNKLRTSEIIDYYSTIAPIKAIQIFTEDSLSYILETDDRFIYIEEFFWWS